MAGPLSLDHVIKKRPFLWSACIYIMDKTHHSVDLKLLKDAKTIWDYMKLNHECQKSDVILCLCSYDVRVADKAAQLWHDGKAEVIVFSGKSGKLTEGLWAKPEAEVFKERAITLGVPEASILVENQSTNTGENVRLCYKLLSENGILPQSVIIVQKPYMERRAYATFLKQWPGNTDHMKIIVTSPEISLLNYPSEVVGDLEYTINILVGDFARIKLYEEKGFQIAQDIPDPVQQAFDRLVASKKYSNHLPE